ncbi:hypothetical protein BDN67DRAFT_168967 [Paxillus ammoniavirescens]|nr:hypothetical protein BDN67DRAFT_168967 [Paxillus ammoniavirescens]
MMQESCHRCIKIRPCATCRMQLRPRRPMPSEVSLSLALTYWGSTKADEPVVGSTPSQQARNEHLTPTCNSVPNEKIESFSRKQECKCPRREFRPERRGTMRHGTWSITRMCARRTRVKQQYRWHGRGVTTGMAGYSGLPFTLNAPVPIQPPKWSSISPQSGLYRINRLNKQVS